MTTANKEAEAVYREQLKETGLELEPTIGDEVVVIGVAEWTPFGDREATWQALLDGRTGVKEFPVGNWRNNIAAPMAPFDPLEHGLTEKDLSRGISPLAALNIVLTGQMFKEAGLLDEEGNLKDFVPRDMVSPCVSSGIGESSRLADVRDTIHHSPDTSRKVAIVDLADVKTIQVSPEMLGEESENPNDMKEVTVFDLSSPNVTIEHPDLPPEKGSRKIPMFEGIKIFPEEINAQMAMKYGLQGWPINSAEACSTGLASVVEGFRLIKGGLAKVAVVGAMEDPLTDYGDMGLGLFAQLRATSGNKDPETASRPYDKERDGFVLGAAGAVLGLASRKFAEENGLPILASVFNARKAIDGYKPTDMDTKNVARTIQKTVFNEETDSFEDVDVILTHATSTPLGDVNEAEALRMAFGDNLETKLITGNKGNVGHSAGASGPVSAIEAMDILQHNIIPPVATTTEVAEEFEGLRIVLGEPETPEKPVDSILVSSFGFGGHDAYVVFTRYRPSEEAAA